MKPEHAAILAECLRREAELKAMKPPPAWKTWDREPYDEQREFGPHFSSAGWFQAELPHQQRRYLRAVRDLERGGLLTTYTRWGRRLTGIQLTAKGRRVAAELASEAAAMPPA